MAAIYDLKRADPAFSFAEGKERYSAYFLRARTREDLQKRTRLHRAIAAIERAALRNAGCVVTSSTRSAPM